MLAFRNVLIPVDFSDFSRQAIKACSTLFAGDDPMEFHFVHVWRIPSEQAVTDPRPELLQQLEGCVGEFTHAGEHTSRVELLTGHPATAICSYARDHGCDLIAMATHGRTGLAHLLIGSTTEVVVRHAPCPVLTLPLSQVTAEPAT
jgi:universal stress protein A